MSTNVKADKVSDKHKTLYHYTTMEGFRGIWQTQTIWAKHFGDLNDTSEVFHLKSQLLIAMVPKVKKVIQEHRGVLKASIRKAGGMGELAQLEAQHVVDAMFQPMFGGHEREPGFTPFITSFCSHHADHPYIQQNGLLSMWRGYGADGGVAILIDTLALEKCLEEETKEYWHKTGSLGDVVYEGDNQSYKNEILPFIDKFTEMALKMITDQSEFRVDSIFVTDFINAASRYKHRAFQEEREVRSTIVPWEKRHFDTAYEFDLTQKRRKKIFEVGGARYLALFDGDLVRRLPIVGIVVGPHPEQLRRKKEIENLTRNHKGIEVWCSETPYVPLHV